MNRLGPVAFLIFSILLLPLIANAEEENPYYFADDTIEKEQSKTRARTLHTGPKTFAVEKVDKKSPKYRKQRSPLEELKFLAPGQYEAKIIGILCNACTNSVLANLKKIKQIGKASFDYEEGILRFKVKKVKKKKKEPVNYFKRDRPLRYSKFRRAIRHAGRRVRLDTRFTISEIKKVR
jgi:copper chaperone CopZ